MGFASSYERVVVTERLVKNVGLPAHSLTLFDIPSFANKILIIIRAAERSLL